MVLRQKESPSVNNWAEVCSYSSSFSQTCLPSASCWNQYRRDLPKWITPSLWAFSDSRASQQNQRGPAFRGCVTYTHHKRRTQASCHFPGSLCGHYTHTSPWECLWPSANEEEKEVTAHCPNKSVGRASLLCSWDPRASSGGYIWILGFPGTLACTLAYNCHSCNPQAEPKPWGLNFIKTKYTHSVSLESFPCTPLSGCLKANDHWNHPAQINFLSLPSNPENQTRELARLTSHYKLEEGNISCLQSLEKPPLQRVPRGSRPEKWRIWPLTSFQACAFVLSS